MTVKGKFAKIGKILSIVGFICSFIPMIDMFSLNASIVGTVFGFIGSNSEEPEAASKAKKFGIAGIIISLVFSFVFSFITALLLES